MNEKIWISWEDQRRSIELSRAFGCKLIIMSSSATIRYLINSFKTLVILYKNKPHTLYVQNPSMVLATIACLYKLVTNNIVIVDRHTTFRINKKPKLSIDWMLFKILNRFTIKYADITIVTNNYLADIVTSLGGKAIVLPDKLPNIQINKLYKLKEGFNVVLISSYGNDEPINTVFNAMYKLCDTNINLYITGNYKKLNSEIIRNKPINTYLTGYLSRVDYDSLICSADAIMVLTDAEYCMLCGCYEAITACKPLITTNKSVLTEYFKESIFVDNTSDSIVSAILELQANNKHYSPVCTQAKQRISNVWNTLFKTALKDIESIKHGK